MEWAGLTCSDVCWWVGDMMQKKRKKGKKLAVFGTIPDFHSVQMLSVGGGGCSCYGDVVGGREGSANRSKSTRVN